MTSSAEFHFSFRVVVSVVVLCSLACSHFLWKAKKNVKKERQFMKTMSSIDLNGWRLHTV